MCIFVQGSKRDLVENCLSYIHSRSGTCRPFMFSRLFCLEDLFSTCLLLSSEKISLQPSDTEISDLLNSTKWDYENSISFFMFDYFCDILMFKLTPSHVPDESEANFKILTPPASKAKTYRELKKPTSSKSKRPKPNFQTPTIPRLMSVLTKHEPVCEHMLVREQSLNSEPEKNKAFCEPVADPFCEPVSEPSPEENFYKPVQIPRIVISEDGSGSGSSEDVILDDSDCSDSIYMNSRNHPLQVVREPYNLRQVVREPHTSAEAMMRKFNHTFISSSPEQQNRSESGNAVSFVPPPGFCHLSQDDSAHQGFNAWSAISPNFLPRSSSDRTSDSQDTICSSETSGKSKGSQGNELSNKSRSRRAHQTYLPRPQ
ncbi:hypothetical protein Btru_021338 [Bulinus truncatus]|nr:hypothetical protein Btru_021338 [Bulinus truncatus]